MEYSDHNTAEPLQEIINNAIAEDIGDGDHSSLACVPAEATGRARLLVKEKGILAGIAFARAVCATIDDRLAFETMLGDGTPAEPGDVAFYVSGKSRSILKAERLLLNGMQRMSAIATKTAKFVKALENTGTQILDTRKTTPGIRLLEKWAVDIGGGTNHRHGLYDMIMIKDNHIDFCGGVEEAIEKTKAYLQNNQLDLKIIVEARDLTEVDKIMNAGGVYRLLLDNFSYADTREAVRKINGKYLTESSGGITLDTAREYAKCGVDFISSGALTHSVHNLDLSLKAVK